MTREFNVEWNASQLLVVRFVVGVTSAQRFGGKLASFVM